MKTSTLAAFVMAVSSVASPAAEFEGVHFPDQLVVNGVTLGLVGCGKREFLFADLYAAALYAAGPTSARELVSTALPRAVILKVTYNGSVPNRVPEAWRSQFAEEARRETMRAFTGIYKELQTGDTLSVRFAPGAGTTVLRNGQVQFSQPSPGAMDAIIGALIGTEAVSGSLRRELLSGKC